MIMAIATLPAAAAELPRVALIIDDLGYQPVLDREALALDTRIAVAIIPDGPLASRWSRKAAAQSREILLHLPMSGLHGDDCANLTRCPQSGWTRWQMAAHLRQALGQVEQAVGLNNHQGSRLTADADAMQELMAGLVLVNRDRKEPLFVIDSRTSPGSRLETSARAAGLAAGRRHVFLDHDPSPAAIEAAWRQLVAHAEQHGHAIGIGHPYPETLAFLAYTLADSEALPVRLVPVSALIRSPADARAGDNQRALAAP